MRVGAEQGSRWAIVVADDHGPESTPLIEGAGTRAPVQYGTLGGAATLLQKALHRAARLVSTSRVLVTVHEDYREHWESALWFVRPECRFVCDDRWSSWLTTAAALLRIARESPSAVAVILPARCFVAHEGVLRAALDEALSILPLVPEGVVTLGMRNIDDGADEDYLVPALRAHGPARPLLGVARRPVSWIAQHLREHGAMVASQILVGDIGALTAHISRNWPGLTSTLLRLGEASIARGIETRIASTLQRGVSAAVLRSLRWYPPSLPQRALCVEHSGWSGLRSPNAVARIGRFVAANRDTSCAPSTIHEEELVAQPHRNP